MESKEQYLIAIKNPFDAYKYSMSNKIWDKHIVDKNSFVWINFIKTYYPNYFDKKEKSIALMDYYVLLFSLDTLHLIGDSFFLSRCQIALSTIPKIRNGDHLRIIHFVNSLSFRSHISNLILFRNNTDNDIHIKKGTLNCVYSENEKICIQFVSKPKCDYNKFTNKFTNKQTGEIHTLKYE
jgi:hypothetical protein